MGKFPHPAYFTYTHPSLLKSEFNPWGMDPEACGLACPTAHHPSVMRVDVATSGGIQQPEYPGSQGYTTPTRTQQTQHKNRTGLCPWRIMQVMKVPCHNGTPMHCKRPDCTLDHSITTTTDVTTRVTATDVANYSMDDSMKETLRAAIRKIAPAW